MSTCADVDQIDLFFFHVITQAFSQPQVPLPLRRRPQEQMDFFRRDGDKFAFRLTSSGKTDAFQQRLAGGEKSMGFGNGTAHGTAALGQFGIECKEQKVIDPGQQPCQGDGGHCP